MTRLIAWNVKIKAAVVSADEREAGVRAHLNFGHTVGHAIESAVGYDKIGHGEAVSLGMVAACELARGRGMIDAEDCARVTTLLRRLGLPIRHPGLDASAIWRGMQNDKKNLGGHVRMVLPTGIGRVRIVENIGELECVLNLAQVTI
jgi:3-dehydroquinate synthase